MQDGTLRPTAILDYGSRVVQQVVSVLSESHPAPREFVQKAHLHLSDVMRPIYSIAERQPASVTMTLNTGSCSQRMACLEALARGFGIPTRVRGLWLRKQFWKERLPLLQPIMPKTLMPWPQFWLEEKWVDFDEIFDSIACLCKAVSHPFTNAGMSLFDAVRSQPVDLLGKSSQFSLKSFVVSETGFFDTRDELLDKFDDRSWVGTLIFNTVYGGKPVRRVNEHP
jgi:hypothetical protein